MFREKIGRRRAIKSVGGIAAATLGSTYVPDTANATVQQRQDKVTDTDTVTKYWSSARAGQGSSLCYYGATWRSDIERWEHRFRLATAAKGVAKDPEDPYQSEEPLVFGEQRYEIKPESSDIAVNVQTDPEFYGISPAKSNNRVLEEAADAVVGLAVGAVNPWLGAAHAFSGVADELVSPSVSTDSNGFEHTVDYLSTYDIEGVNRASHYHRFTINQEDCTSIRGCQDDERYSTVTMEMIEDPNYGLIDYSTEVKFEIKTQTGDDSGSVGAFSNPEDSLHPEEMSEQTKEELGVEKVRTMAGKSSSQEVTYYASDFPIVVDKL